ncbi:copper resistance protein B [Phenylobacterium sp.]|uniref:copper resistance protein B n=1 Tax=Phenylobacterium sp. TaxID=1871053 RepID=UPI0035B42FE1
MNRLIFLILLSSAAAAPALAQTDPHAGHDMSAMGGAMGDDMPAMDHDMSSMKAPSASAAAPPPAPKDHAADTVFPAGRMAHARAVLTDEHGGHPFWKVMVNTAEMRAHSGTDDYAWRGEAWIGGDINRLVVKSEGEGASGERPEAAEAQAVYSRAISPYFDLQAGLRQDFRPEPSRTFAVLGLEGLTPYGAELSLAGFVSNRGEASARLEAAYDFRITQRLVLQPRTEINLVARDAPERGLASGLSDAEYGLRLRYHLARELAPYIGVVHLRRYGGTADLARAAGEDPTRTSLVVGVRAWF